MTLHDIDISQHRIAEFCRRHHVRRLAVFGSALRDDFRADSDVDLLTSDLVVLDPELCVRQVFVAGKRVVRA